jgi:hypothetical protein
MKRRTEQKRAPSAEKVPMRIVFFKSVLGLRMLVSESVGGRFDPPSVPPVPPVPPEPLVKTDSGMSILFAPNHVPSFGSPSEILNSPVSLEMKTNGGLAALPGIATMETGVAVAPLVSLTSLKVFAFPSKRYTLVVIPPVSG